MAVELPSVGERWRRRKDGRLYEVAEVSPPFGGWVRMKEKPKGRSHWLMAENLLKRYEPAPTDGRSA